MNKELFRSIMDLFGDTDATLSEYLGISEQTLCKKIDEDGAEFRLHEIRLISNRYGFDSDLIDRIFFAD